MPACRDAGMDDFLTFPVDRENLLLKVTPLPLPLPGGRLFVRKWQGALISQLTGGRGKVGRKLGQLAWFRCMHVFVCNTF